LHLNSCILNARGKKQEKAERKFLSLVSGLLPLERKKQEVAKTAD